MKRWLPSIFLALAVAAGSQAASSPRVRLQYALEEGSTIPYRIKIETKTVQTVKDCPVERLDRRDLAVEWRLGAGSSRARQVRVMLTGSTGAAETPFGVEPRLINSLEDGEGASEAGSGAMSEPVCTFKFDRTGRLSEAQTIFDVVMKNLEEIMEKSAAQSELGEGKNGAEIRSVEIGDTAVGQGIRNFCLAAAYFLPQYKSGSVRVGQAWRSESFFSDSIYRGAGSGQTRLAEVATETCRLQTEAALGHHERIEGGFFRSVTPDGRFELHFGVEIELTGTLQAEYLIDRRDCWPRQGRILVRLTGWSERLGLKFPVTIESVVSYERLPELEGGLAS